MDRLNFDREWRFHLGDEPESKEIGTDDSSWQIVDLPHDWSIGLERGPNEPSGAAGGYFPMGRGWYRKTFQDSSPYHLPLRAPAAGLPKGEGANRRKVWIEFEGVYMNAEVWLNEHFLGRHPYGYTGFSYDLTPFLKVGELNLLRVFVDNAHQVNSRWYSGSGIYRHVWLVKGNPIHVANGGIILSTPDINQEVASVSIQTKVENESDDTTDVTVHWHIRSSDGRLASEAEVTANIGAGAQVDFSRTLKVDGPELWSPESPTLYRLEADIVTQGNVVDTANIPFGIRSLEFDVTHGFQLNGQKMKLKGGCVHHDNGVLGAASYDRAEERKVELLKASGFNAVRCAHNPPAPAFLDACDRLGMLVIDEAFDCWRHGKNPGDYHVAFDDWWQRDLESMVQRDSNHPSIVMWSIGNEIAERGRPEGVELAHRLADHIRELDPSRPVTSAVCEPWQKEWAWPATKDYFAALDVGGYNYQWAQYLPDHQQHPQRVMVGMESFPKDAFENWMSVLENDWVIGDFVWTALDYLGESGIGRVNYGKTSDGGLGEYPWHQANCGDLDLCGFKRPQSYYRDILWGSSPGLYIAVHDPVVEGQTPSLTLWGWPDVSPCWTWPGHEGEMLTVDVYSACDRVELFLNGGSLGIKPAGKTEKLIATFSAPYEPGELKAIGYMGGQRLIEAVIETAGAPQRIQLTPDRSAIQVGDLSYVTVEVVDPNGQLCPKAMDTIEFSVEGEGSILAVGSADPTNMERYTGSRHKVFRGRGLVVVKAGWTTGEVKILARAEGLEEGKAVIRMHG